MSRSVSEERERLLRIIGFCVDVESRGVDPFEVEIKGILETLRKYLPNWKILDDLVLDSETLKQIAGIVRLQGDWVKNHSTSIFIDPLLIEIKIKLMNTQHLLEIFQRSWHPMVEMERLSPIRLEQAIDYWNGLISLKERQPNFPESSDSLCFITAEELAKRNILSEESFRETLESLWRNLKNCVGREGKVNYWDFVIQDTYDKTVKRAYNVSFLITYGYAMMQINPLEEEVFLIPNKEIVEPAFGKQALTIPIAINRGIWEKMVKKK